MIGKQIAHFEVVGKLGEGGMGVVYDAIDRHLDRHVALKILPPDKVANAARKQRFIQEAKAASALNHPNIVTIYDIGVAAAPEANPIDYIAMELVPGRTLEDVIGKRRLKLAEALKYAVQLADALAAAHAAGIVHRDLKPANMMVTDTGLVKVLDFGLAKLTDVEEVTEDDATRTDRAMTEEGTVVGSAAYMSPEQAEGKKVDARSDIFSFGLVLYEMLTGQRAFRAETRMSTMAAILNKEPQPLAGLAPDIPKELERIVVRCLRKDLTRRSQSMAEIKIELQELKEETESGVSGSAAPAVKKRRLHRPLVVLGAILIAAGLGFVIVPRLREPRAPLKVVPLTSYTGFQGYPSLSPDGTQFAFSWDGDKEHTPPQLYVSLIGRGTPLRLTNYPDAAAYYAAWSPDGQMIAFVRHSRTANELISVPALGGPERNLGTANTRVAWSPDGKWLYSAALASSGTGHLNIFAQPSSGGDRRYLTDPPGGGGGDFDPSVSPDGSQLVFVRSVADWDYDLFVLELRDSNTPGALRRLTTRHDRMSSPTWTADGKDIVYVEGNASSLLAIYRVAASGGEPVRIEEIGDSATNLAIAPKAHRLVYSRTFQDYNIWRMPLPEAGHTQGRPEKFLSSTRFEESPAFSPDGKRIAFSSNRSGVRQIWVADADGSNPVALTNFTIGVAGSPKWSPDGQTIVFDARPNGAADIYTVRPDGGPVKRLTDHPAEDHLPCYSADGRSIYFTSTRSGEEQVFRIPAGGGEVLQITKNGAHAPLASPDGKWVYYSKLSRNHGALWKVPADGGEETQVLPDSTLPASTLSFCVTPSGIWFAGTRETPASPVPLRLYRFQDGKVLDIGSFEKQPALHITVSPDEKWIAYSQLDTSVNDLMLVENFR